jgi:hypothetical protein
MRRVHRNNLEQRRCRESRTSVTLTLKQVSGFGRRKRCWRSDNLRTVEIRGTRMRSQLIRDPAKDRLLTPQNSTLIIIIDYLPVQVTTTGPFAEILFAVDGH